LENTVAIRLPRAKGITNYVSAAGEKLVFFLLYGVVLHPAGTIENS